MPSYKKMFALASFAAFSCFTAQAQKDSLTATKELQPVEIRAIRAGANTPFAKTQIAGKELQNANTGQDIPFLLQYTPSAVATSDAGAGVGYTSLRVRGTDNTRINVTFNGIPVNDAESQGTFFVNFGDLASSTGSIQLQRGVGTSTNGAGAFGATMSISNLQQMAVAGVEVNNTYGSFNTWKNTVKAGTGLLSNGLSFDMRLSRITSDGYRERSSASLKALQLTASWQMNTNNSLLLMFMTGKEKTGQAWNGVLQAQLDGDSASLMRHYRHNQGFMYFTAEDSINLFHSNPRTNNYFTYQNQTDNYRQDYYQLFFNHRFSKTVTAQAAAFLTRGIGYYEEYKPWQKYKDYGLQNYVSPSGSDTIRKTDMIRQLWLDNYFYGGTFSFLYKKNTTEITVGGAFSRYEGSHYGYVEWAQDGGVPNDYRWYLLHSQKNDGNIYAKIQQYAGEKLILFGDLQYRNIYYQIDGFRKNPSLQPIVIYNFFNPKAGITYLIKNTFTEKQKAYASFAIANREPNRDDFEASPTNLPKPERLYDVEAGYEINKLTWSAGANLYYMDYKDQLILTGKINDVGAYTRTNVAKSYRAGIELQGAAKPASWLSLNANATFSQNKINNFTEYIDNWDTGLQDDTSHGATDIAFSPNIIAGGGLTIMPFPDKKLGKALAISLLEKYVGKQYLDNTGNEGRIIKPYALTDIRVRYSLPLHPFKEIGFTVGLNNVFGAVYESNGYTYAYKYGGQLYTDNYYYPQAGFNWLIAVNVKW